MVCLSHEKNVKARIVVGGGGGETSPSFVALDLSFDYGGRRRMKGK